MGKIRIKTLGVDEVEKKEKIEAKKRKEAKALKAEIVEKDTVSEAVEAVDVTVSPDVHIEEEIEGKELAEEKKGKKTKKGKESEKKISHGGKYLKAHKLVDAKAYTIPKAVALIKKLTYAGFDESVELHLSVADAGIKGEIALPHGTGKTVRVAIVDDSLLDALEGGKIEFDILLTTPAYMPKLAKYAKLLGPRGLMPNPKLGTITDKPEAAMKKFQAGAVRYKTEAKFPLMHQVVGKMSFSEDQLIANIKEFVKSVGVAKIKTAHIAGSMTPSVELDISSI